MATKSNTDTITKRLAPVIRPEIRAIEAFKHAALGITLATAFLFIAHIAVEVGVDFAGMEMWMDVGAVAAYGYAVSPVIAWAGKMAKFVVWGDDGE